MFTKCSQNVHKISIERNEDKNPRKAQLLNAQQTATLLNCHVKTLYEWTREGRIGCIRTGRNLKFHPQHLQEYFDRQSRG
jgi:excisionase family DNA binding protein